MRHLVPDSDPNLVPSDEAAPMQRLRERMARSSLAPLWELYRQLVRPEPDDAEPSHLWRWSDMLPAVDLAARAVQGELADHRVLLLAHPAGTARPSTTRHLIAGLQCVLPGEQTVEHRHTANACRLILEGSGATTFVDGKACSMEENDFILTPNWTWHAHRNPGAERAVWLDLLDVPLMGALHSTFGEGGPAPGYGQALAPDAAFAGGGMLPLDPPRLPYSPRLRWAWGDVQAALEAMPADADGGRRLRFTNPLDGGAVTATLDAVAMQLEPGRSSTAARSSADAVCVVLQGAGRSQIGAVEHRWGRRDIFSLPHWQWTTHTAEDGCARLLVVSAREALRRLGLLREESRPAAS